MRLTGKTWAQLAVFAVVSVVAASFMIFDYIQLPKMLLGAGHYRVTVELPESAGLYKSGNVTYRGTEVGRVESVSLTDSGVEAVLSLDSSMPISADLLAEVHSVSPLGEQYVALLPRGDGTGPVLKNGDVIPIDDVTVPPPIGGLLDATNTGLQAIPRENLRTVIDESAIAVGGLGPEISRFVKGSTALAIDAREDLPALTRLIDEAAPVLDTQADTSGAIQNWASHLATVTTQLKDNDLAVRQLIEHGGEAADRAQDLVNRVKPGLPVLLSNLVGLKDVAVAYHPSLEQTLVLLVPVMEQMQAIALPNLKTKQDYQGIFLSFNLNLNVPPPCTTGYLPASQRRPTTFVDAPDRPAGDIYCRTPQDSQFNVRGARNFPCVTKPGKRAPTARMCESDEEYVPLNEGTPWKGDPNVTLSGQPIPQPWEGTPSPAPPPEGQSPPVAIAPYDPATGSYIGPDGQTYTRSDLSETGSGEQTWQSMLTPPQS